MNKPKSARPRATPQLVAWHPRRADKVVDAVVKAWVIRYGLTRAECAVLYASTFLVGGHTQIADSFHVQSSTIRSQSGALCRKTGARGLSEAAVLVLREALRGT